MSFQTLKRTVVLAGAILATQTLSAADPTARSGSRAAYNESTGTAILFGGATANDPGSARNYALDETWEWDGTRWIHRYPKHSPAGRSSHSMTYDSNRERVLLFGGTNGTEELSDTWVYEGRDWRQIDTPNAPVGRVSSTLAFDPLRDRVVLFGGLRLSDDKKSQVKLFDMWAHGLARAVGGGCPRGVPVPRSACPRHPAAPARRHGGAAHLHPSWYRFFVIINHPIIKSDRILKCSEANNF